MLPKLSIFIRKINRISLIFISLTLGLTFLYFGNKYLPITYIIPQFFVFTLFFYGLYYFTRKLFVLPRKRFILQLFWIGVFIRLIIVGILYLVFYSITDSPFEPEAGDSLVYDMNGFYLGKWFQEGNYNISKYFGGIGWGDWGYNIYTAIVYSIMGPYTFWPRFIQVFLGAFTAVFVYKIAATLIDEKTGRLSGIICMIFPYLLHYTGFSLKETIMIFLLMLAVWKSVELIHGHRFKTGTIISLIVSAGLIFFFRNFLGVLFLISFMFYFLFTHSKSKGRKGAVLVVFMALYITFITFFDFSSIIAEASFYAEKSSSQMGVELADKASRGTSFQTAIVSPLIFISSFFAPFASLVDTGQIKSALQIGAALAKNALSFFVVLGLWYSLSNNWKRSNLLIILMLSYTFVLAMSAQVTSHRYQLVAAPFFIIFASVGIIQYPQYIKKIWPIYLVFIFLVTLAWNIFKINIRG